MFEDAYGMWTERRPAQEQAAELLYAGVPPLDGALRRGRVDGVRDRRVSRASHRAAPVNEVVAIVNRYETGHEGWNAGNAGGSRKRREPVPLPGALLH